MDRQTLTYVGRASIALGLLLAASLFCATGHAQWLPDRNYTEGPGIRVGNLELHPGVAVRAGYDNNVFRQAPGRRQGSPIIAVTPHLHLSTLSKQRLEGGEDSAGGRQAPAPIAFRTGMALTYFYYNLDRAPRNLEVDADAMVSILPERPVGFEVGALYNRSTRPFTQFTGDRGNDVYAVHTVTPTGRMVLQSRSGVLRARVGYTPQISRFENDIFSYLNANVHAIGGDASWQFLPRTALVYDVAVDLTRYTDAVTPQSMVLLSNDTRVATRLGINGALTNSLGLRVLAGYAMDALKNPLMNDLETFVGEAVLAYRFRAHTYELGYRRSVLPSRLGGWMQQDRGFTQLRLMFARVFSLGLEAGIAHAVYGRLLTPSGADPLGRNRDTGASTDERKDLRIDGGAHAEYRVTNWLAIMADFSVLSTLTDFEYSAQVNAPPLPAKFTSIQAFGGLRAHY